jgi:putative membrane protein insertion efficiency factor
LLSINKFLRNQLDNHSNKQNIKKSVVRKKELQDKITIEFKKNMKILLTMFLTLEFLLSFPSFGWSQKPFSDNELIKKQKFINKKYEPVKIEFVTSKSSNPVKKYNPLNYVFGSFLFAYQKVFSAQFSASCLYNPSCSNFSKQLISEYGIFKGIFTTADRLMRCNRISATGIQQNEIDSKDHKVHEKVDYYRFKSK